MTNDYKENLLEYLTGNIAQGIQAANPLYKEVVETEYSYNPNDINGSRVVRCKDGKGNYNGLVLYYAHEGSVITLVDPKDMTIIKKFTTFSSGTALGHILNLEVDEVGNVYGMDYIVQNGTNIYRIILLNNISEIAKGQSDYQVILRNSYYVQGYDVGDDINPSYETFLMKSSQSATYYFALQEGTGTLLMPSTFKINVGAANEWTRLDDLIFANGNIDVGNIYFNINDEPVAEYFGTELHNGEWLISRGYAVGDGQASYENIVTNIISTYYNANTSNVENFEIKLNSNYYGNFYMILNGRIKDNNNQYAGTLKIYNVDNGNVEHLATYESPKGSQSDVAPYYVRGEVLNGDLLLYMAQWSNGLMAKMCFSLLSPTNEIDYFYLSDYENNWSRLGVARVGYYNLYDEYVINAIIRETNDDPWDLISYKIVYNPNRYNGTQYKDKTMLAPGEALLFDSNDNLLMARNLYNVKVYNNQSMATLNIPNNLLNNETISKENLYGMTNYELMESTQEITKNVYENVYINFLNAISMQNQNTSDYVYNLPGASRLNLSSGKNFDYDNAKASKIRVTYDDNTYYVTSVPNSINNGVCTYQIGIHVPSDKNVLKIEIISNDEITTYQTITNLNLTNNKYYIITQDVYID